MEFGDHCNHWADESYDIVKEEIYKSINQQENSERNSITEPSKEYIEHSRAIAEK